MWGVDSVAHIIESTVAERRPILLRDVAQSEGGEQRRTQSNAPLEAHAHAYPARAARGGGSRPRDFERR